MWETYLNHAINCVENKPAFSVTQNKNNRTKTTEQEAHFL